MGTSWDRCSLAQPQLRVHVATPWLVLYEKSGLAGVVEERRLWSTVTTML